MARCEASEVYLRLRHPPPGDLSPELAEQVVGLEAPGEGLAASLLRQATGLRCVVMRQPGPEDLAAIAQLAQLELLSISEGPADELPAFFGSMRSTALSNLQIRDTPLGDRRIASIVSNASVHGLTNLALETCRAGAKGGASIASAGLTSLRSLGLNHSSLRERGLAALCASTDLSQLHTLQLYAAKLGDEALVGLRQAGFASTLRLLNLGDNGLTDAGVATLAAASFPALRILYLHRNPIGTAGVRTLRSAPWLDQLEYLNLSGKHLDAEGHELVARTPALSRPLARAGRWDASNGAVFR